MTGTEMITAALQLLGVLAETESPSSEVSSQPFWATSTSGVHRQVAALKSMALLE